MKGFKEWLSDNLRYLMLLAAVLLGVGAIVMGMKMYRAYREDKAAAEPSTQEVQSGDVVILGQDETETAVTEMSVTQAAAVENDSETIGERASELTEDKSEEETEAQTEKTASQTGKSTEKESASATVSQTGKDTEKETAAQTEAQKETSSVKATQSETAKESEKTVSRPDVQIIGQSETLPQNETQTGNDAGTSSAQAQPVSEKQSEMPVQTETVRQTEEIDTLISTPAATKYASSGANVRSGPGTGYSVLGDVSQGESLQVTGQTSSWYQVKYNGRTAYISKSLVTDVYTPVYMTMTGTCYLRSEADYGDNIIGEFYAGTTVEYLGDAGGWVHVRVDGLEGYMGSRFFR